MRTLRQRGIKNCPEYIFNSITNIRKPDTNLVILNQLSFVYDNAVNFEIEYSKDYDDAYPLYLVFNDVDAYFQTVDEDKYLIFASTDKNKRLLENYKKLWNEVQEKIRTIKGGIEPFEYEKDLMRIKFESDNELLLGEILNISVCVIIARSVFEDNSKFYPQVHLINCYLKCDYAEYSYICCKTPLKSINCTDYGLFLSETRS